MKRSIVVFAVLSVVIGISSGVYVYCSKNKGNDDIFDNSKPGLWRVTTKLESPKKSFNGEKYQETCITKETIEESKKKTLQSRFNFEGLKCEEHFFRVGEEKASFTLDCKGINPVKKNKVESHITGVMESKPEFNYLQIKYEVNNTHEKESFELKTESSRIGDCKE